MHIWQVPFPEMGKLGRNDSFGNCEYKSHRENQQLILGVSWWMSLRHAGCDVKFTRGYTEAKSALKKCFFKNPCM